MEIMAASVLFSNGVAFLNLLITDHTFKEIFGTLCRLGSCGSHSFRSCEHLVKTRAEIFLTDWRYLVGAALERRGPRRWRSSAEAGQERTAFSRVFGAAEPQFDWNESRK